jgi:hypothetical protein
MWGVLNLDPDLDLALDPDPDEEQKLASPSLAYVWPILTQSFIKICLEYF